MLYVSGLGQCMHTTFAFNMVLGPADVPEGGPDDQLVDQVGLLPLGTAEVGQDQQSQVKADDPKFFCRCGSVPGNLWLPLVKRTKNLLSSATVRVQNVLRQCTQTKPVSRLLRAYVASCIVDMR